MGDEIFIIRSFSFLRRIRQKLASRPYGQLLFSYGLSFPGQISQLFTANGKNGNHAITSMKWEIHSLSSPVLLS